MYTTPWCGYCYQLKTHLTRDGIKFQEVNIENDPESAAYVMEVNGGNQTVPTLRFEDGTALTNPTPDQVRSKLQEIVVAS